MGFSSLHKLKTTCWLFHFSYIQTKTMEWENVKGIVEGLSKF